MTYFRIQHAKQGHAHKYDIFKIEGNDSQLIGTKFLPQKLKPEEVNLFRLELKRIHEEKLKETASDTH